MSRLALAALALLAVLAVPTLAGAESRADRDAQRLERAAVRLINDVSRDVRRARPACSFRPPDERSADVPVNDADPSPAFTSVLAIFRRPPTDAEVGVATAAGAREWMGGGLLEVSRRGTRVATSASGAEFTLTAYNRARRTGPDLRTYTACQDAIGARLAAERARPAVRRAAQRIFARVRRDEARAISELPDVFPVISMHVREPGQQGSGGTGGRFDPERFAARGLWLSSGGGPRERRSAVLSGLVPDGVASIDFAFGRRASRGPNRDAVDYGEAVTVSAAVRDNVVSLRVPRPAEDAFAPRMVWRGADGEVVRVVRAPR